MLPLGAAVAAVAVGGLPSAGLLRPTTSAASDATLHVTTNPALVPAFDPNVTDYVVRCSGSPIAVTVDAPADMVSVDGHAAATGRLSTDVSRSTGQGFTLVARARTGGADQTYYVRCLPTDYPDFTATRTGRTQAAFYVTVPIAGSGSGPGVGYPTIFDSDGVPMWWGPKTSTPFTELLGDGDIAWTKSDGTPAEERRLDGALVATTTTQGGPPDQHDLLRLTNGDDVMAADVVRTGIDLAAAWGPSYPSNASVMDQVIEELTPAGAVAWSWDALAHIPLTETDPQWRGQMMNGSYDAYHWNSVEWTGSGFLLSFRHLNAVYDVDQHSSAIVWKLGGTPTAASLHVVGDLVFSAGGDFGGQHDARLLPDGSVTLFDDGTGLGRAPRAVRYRIDPPAHTATMLEQVTDPAAGPDSSFGGSARRLSGGDWVVGWGGTNTISELTGADTRVFLLQFSAGTSVYRAVPVAAGQLSRAVLRGAMDRQYPSPPSVTKP